MVNCPILIFAFGIKNSLTFPGIILLYIEVAPFKNSIAKPFMFFLLFFLRIFHLITQVQSNQASIFFLRQIHLFIILEVICPNIKNTLASLIYYLTRKRS